MEQVQQASSENKKSGRPSWIYIGLVVLFFVVAGAAAFLTFNYVKDFVASWNITDLPTCRGSWSILALNRPKIPRWVNPKWQHPHLWWRLVLNQYPGMAPAGLMSW